MTGKQWLILLAAAGAGVAAAAGIGLLALNTKEQVEAAAPRQ